MRRYRVGYANVMSTIAVFIALGGTTYAAITLPQNSVGNRQLRSGAVSSSKVRDGSIAARDLASSARGSRGPRGPAGPTGSSGPTGAGNIIVRTREVDPARPALGAGSYVDVLSVALPAGHWIVFATTQVTNFPTAATADYVRCFIAVDGERRGIGKVQAAGTVPGATSTTDLSLIEVVDKPAPASVALLCGHDAEIPAGSDLRLDRSKLVAIPVESADVRAVAG